MKTDLYTFVHKAHRFRLFHMSIAIARADFGDPAEAAAIGEQMRTVIEHLRDHAAIEEHYIHPLYRRVAEEVAATFEREHRDLENEIEALEKILAAEDGARLHRAYNGFLGRYMVHLEEEEQRQEDVLWRLCGDEELAEVFSRFQRERSPEKLRSDLELFLPALSARELTGMFLGMKLKAPAFVFEFAQGLGAALVEPARWQKVLTAIA